MFLNFKKVFTPLKLPLWFFVVSSIPLLFFSYFSSNTVWFYDLGLNFLCVLISLILAFIIPIRWNPVVTFLSFLLKLKTNTQAFNFMIITFILITLELVSIFVFDNKNLISSLIELDAKQARVKLYDVPFYISIITSNYSAVLLLCIGVSYGYFKDGARNKKLLFLLLIFVFSIIYLGALKKSTFIIYIYFLFIIFSYGRYRIFNLKNIIIGLVVTLLFYFILISYYPDGDILNKLTSRIFLHSIGDSAIFTDLYMTDKPLGLDFVPSQGSELFGYDGISLEKKLFLDLYPNRIDRYGMYSTLNYTYAKVVFGSINSIFILSLIYLLNIQILIYCYRLYIKKNTYHYYLNFHIFSIMLFTIFQTGVFKTTSFFIIFPVSTYLYLIVFILLKRKNVYKKV